MTVSSTKIQSDVALNLPVHQKIPQRHRRRMMPGQTKVAICKTMRHDDQNQIQSSTLLKWTMHIKRHQHIHTKIVAASLKLMCAAKILLTNPSARGKKPTTKRTGMMRRTARACTRAGQRELLMAAKYKCF